MASPIEPDVAREAGLHRDQVPRQEPPAGSTRLTEDTLVSVHEEPYVIYEYLPRGPGSAQTPVPAPKGWRLDELLEPYKLVIKRPAREKWLGFTEKDIRGLDERELNKIVHKSLFPAVPDDMLDLKFVLSGGVDSENVPVFEDFQLVNKEKSETEKLDWKTFLCQNNSVLSEDTDDEDDRNDSNGRGRKEWYVFRHWDSKTEFIVVRDGWAIDYPARWNIYRDVERGHRFIKETRIAEMSGEENREYPRMPERSTALREDDIERDVRREATEAFDTIKRLEEILKELFPKAWKENRMFTLQVDRFKGEYLRYPPKFRLREFRTNEAEKGRRGDVDPDRPFDAPSQQTRKNRLDFFMKILWRIDDPIINVYPEGRTSKETYEQFEERKRSYLEDVERQHRQVVDGAVKGLPDDVSLPRQMKLKELTNPPAEEHYDDTDNRYVPTAQAADEARKELSAGECLERANNLLCRDHKGCRARLDVMSEMQRESHVKMHGDTRCGVRQCHAWVNLMNTEERTAHDTMHYNWGKDPDDQAAFPEYIVAPSQEDWKICPRHPKCHAQMFLMDAKDYRWHDHMHTARRCNLNLNCYTPLDLLDGKELVEHVDMHNRYGDDTTNELRVMLESPGIYDASKLAEALEKPGNLVSKEKETRPVTLGEHRSKTPGGGETAPRDMAEADEAPQGNTTRTGPPGKQTRKSKRISKKDRDTAYTERDAAADEAIERDDDEEEEEEGGGDDEGFRRKAQKGPKRKPDGGVDEQPPRKKKKKKPERPTEEPPADGTNDEAAKWADGWEPGVAEKEGNNKYEHCTNCDAYLNRANKDNHLRDKCTDAQTRWKRYRGGKKKKEE